MMSLTEYFVSTPLSMELKLVRRRNSELLMSITRLQSWSLQKEAPVLKPSDIRLIFWKHFQASILLPCISISSHSAFTNVCFCLRNKRRSSLLFSRYFSQARVAAMGPGIHRSSQVLPGDIDDMMLCVFYMSRAVQTIWIIHMFLFKKISEETSVSRYHLRQVNNLLRRVYD